jgi:nicotinate-nucleotide adenylyltransferase
VEKIGVLGGTFDPVHLGHIGMAEAAREALGLNEVVLVPAGQPMSKVNQPITPSGDRLNMLHLAVKTKPGLTVSTIEIERPGPSYTVDTLNALRRQSGAGVEIYFILGWDSLSQLPEWRDPARLIKICRLVTVPRPGCPRPDMKLLESRIPGISNKVIFLEKPFMDISASRIKEMAARGEKIGHLVPGPVAGYIKRHKLYQKAGGKR